MADKLLRGSRRGNIFRIKFLMTDLRYKPSLLRLINLLIIFCLKSCTRISEYNFQSQSHVPGFVHLRL